MVLTHFLTRLAPQLVLRSYALRGCSEVWTVHVAALSMHPSVCWYGELFIIQGSQGGIQQISVSPVSSHFALWRNRH